MFNNILKSLSIFNYITIDYTLKHVKRIIEMKMIFPLEIHFNTLDSSIH